MNAIQLKNHYLKFNFGVALLMIGLWLLISCRPAASPINQDGKDLPSQEAAEEIGEEDADSTQLPYYIDNILDGMAQGQIAFNVPDSVVELDQSFPIQLLLDPVKSIRELESALGASGPSESYQIRISDNMKASLTGSGFEIRPITPEEQLVSTIQSTEWKWEVKAVKPGPQRLYLALSAIIKFQGEEKIRTIRTFEREMLVKVSFRKRVVTFVGKNWQWLWTALVVPVAGWLWKRKSVKKRVKK